MMGRRRSSLTAAWPITALFGCLGVLLLGCDDFNAGTSPPDTEAAEAQKDPKPPGYDKALAYFKEAEASLQRVISLLQATRTGQDFETNVDGIKRSLDDMLTNIERGESIVADWTHKESDELNQHLEPDSQTEQHLKTLKSEVERVSQIRDIPFHVRMDFSSYCLRLQHRMLMLWADAQMNEARRDWNHLGRSAATPIEGPNRVQITLEGENSDNLTDILGKIGSLNRGRMRATNGRIELGDVQDFDGLVAALKENVGTVRNVNREGREITVVVDASKIPAAAPIGIGADSGFPTAGMPPGFGSGDTAPSGFGSGPPSGFGSGPPAGLGAPSGGSPFGLSGAPELIYGTNDPDDLVKIIERGDDRGREDAVRKLAAADPSEASKETKKAVALALKTVAFDKDADDKARALAAEGMARWAGKYAAPQLLQILKHSSDAFFDEDLHNTILRILGELKHPDTLEPIVLGFADGSLNSEAAAECLVQFGPEAEPLILKHCRPGDPSHSKNVVYVLGKIGTSRSLPALRALSRTHDGFVLRDEIARAAEAIKTRRRTGTK